MVANITPGADTIVLGIAQTYTLTIGPADIPFNLVPASATSTSSTRSPSRAISR